MVNPFGFGSGGDGSMDPCVLESFDCGSSFVVGNLRGQMSSFAQDM